MGMEGGKVIKFLVMFFNFLFLIFGLVLLGVGAYAEAKFGDFTKLSSVDFASGSRLLIAVGVIIAVIAFFGCCGAWKENRCFLGVFIALLFIMLILEIASAALAYQHRDELAKSLKNDMNNTIVKEYGKDKVKTEVIDFLQRENKCCGVVSYKDWAFNSNYNITSVPDSCCVEKSKGCGSSFSGPKNPSAPQLNIWTKGCYDRLTKDIKDHLGTVAGVAVAIVVIQILGMVFSFCLIRRIGKETYA